MGITFGRDRTDKQWREILRASSPQQIVFSFSLRDGGMRAGIVDSKARKRTITVYTTKSAFKNQLGIPDEEAIYIFLVNKSGKILWQTKGDFTEEKNQQLRLVLEENK